MATNGTSPATNVQEAWIRYVWDGPVGHKRLEALADKLKQADAKGRVKVDLKAKKVVYVGALTEDELQEHAEAIHHHVRVTLPNADRASTRLQQDLDRPPTDDSSHLEFPWEEYSRLHKEVEELERILEESSKEIENQRDRADIAEGRADALETSAIAQLLRRDRIKEFGERILGDDYLPPKTEDVTRYLEETLDQIGEVVEKTTKRPEGVDDRVEQYEADLKQIREYTKRVSEEAKGESIEIPEDASLQETIAVLYDIYQEALSGALDARDRQSEVASQALRESLKLVKENEMYRSQHDKARSDACELKLKVKGLEAERKSLEKDIKKRVRDTYRKKLERVKSGLNEEKRRLQRDRDALEKRLSEQQRQYELVKEELGSKDDEIASTRKEYRKLQARFEKVEEERIAIEIERDEIQRQCDELYTRIEGLEHLERDYVLLDDGHKELLERHKDLQERASTSVDLGGMGIDGLIGALLTKVDAGEYNRIAARYDALFPEGMDDDFEIAMKRELDHILSSETIIGAMHYLQIDEGEIEEVDELVDRILYESAVVIHDQVESRYKIANRALPLIKASALTSKEDRESKEEQIRLLKEDIEVYNIQKDEVAGRKRRADQALELIKDAREEYAQARQQYANKADQVSLQGDIKLYAFLSKEDDKVLGNLLIPSDEESEGSNLTRHLLPYLHDEATRRMAADVDISTEGGRQCIQVSYDKSMPLDRVVSSFDHIVRGIEQRYQKDALYELGLELTIDKRFMEAGL